MMTQVMESAWWHLAGWTMLGVLVVGLLIGCAGAILRGVLGRCRPVVRYWCALILLGLLATSPAFVLIIITPEMVRPMIADDLANQSTTAHDAQFNEAGAQAGESASARTLPITDNEYRAIGSTQAPAHITRAVHLLPWIWLGGAPVTLLLMLFGVIGAERLRHCSESISSGTIHNILRRAVEQMNIRARVAVAICDRIATPALVGVIRPMILLPPAAVTGWPIEQLEMAIMHELAHIRRLDNLVNLLQRLIEAVYFFNPAVWYISNWVRAEREYCCDDVVVAQGLCPTRYASFLTVLAVSSMRIPSPALGLAATGVKRRVVRILGGQTNALEISRAQFTVAVLTIFLSGAALLLLAPIASPAVADAHAENQPAGESGPEDSILGGAAPGEATPSERNWTLADLPQQIRSTVSVRPVNTRVEDGGVSSVVGQSVTLREALHIATGIRRDLIVGPTDFLDETVLDFRIDERQWGASRDTGALVSALYSTFRLSLRVEEQEREVFVLRKGIAWESKLIASDLRNWMSLEPGQCVATGIDMAYLCGKLEEELSLPVIDETQLNGWFDLSLRWNPDEPASLIAAVHEQVGLALVRETRPFDLLLVDVRPRQPKAADREVAPLAS